MVRQHPTALRTFVAQVMQGLQPLVHYRGCTLGQVLFDSLAEMCDAGLLSQDLADRAMIHFDEV